MIDIQRQPELAIGHYLTLRRPPEYGQEGGDFTVRPDGWAEMRFQNFWISRNAIWRDPVVGQDQVHSFLPFGFSGVSVSRSGDNVDASLMFPNNELARSFVNKAVKETWTAVVRVCQINNLTDPNDPPPMLIRYSGQVASGSWDDSELVLRCNSILDAVGSDVPARTLHQGTVGNVPISGNVSL